MPTKIPFPPEIAEVYFDFDWEREAVWALELATNLVKRQDLEWHLDLPFWSSVRGQMLFDVRPREVIQNSGRCHRHAKRIEEADLGFPIDVMRYKGRFCIMDGLHRLSKATQENRSHLTVRQVPASLIREILLMDAR